MGCKGGTVMMISTKGRYALRVMVDLAEHWSGNYIPLKEVAARQEISEKYLESIVKVLVRNSFLEGIRGKGGGYRLTKSPDQITVGSVLRLMEGSLSPVACLEQDAAECPRASLCKTLTMWQNLYTMVNDYFDGITISDLTGGEEPGNNYVI